MLVVYHNIYHIRRRGKNDRESPPRGGRLCDPALQVGIAHLDNVIAVIQVVAADLYRRGYSAFAPVVVYGGGAGRVFARDCPEFFDFGQGD